MTLHDLLVPLPIFLPLVGAAITLIVGRDLTAQRWAAGTTCLATAVAALALVRAVVAHDAPIAVQLGGWDAPFGITLVADRLSVALVATAAIVIAAVYGYALGELHADTERLFFHPIYLIMAAGIAMSFLAGDMFNLFVAFEVTLIASYVLLTLGASRQQMRTGMTYVVINLLASTLLVVGVALLYAATGTVNMADLAVRLGDIPDHLRAGFGVLFLVVFGIKAGLFPLFFWLPDSYPTAPIPVTAIFGALLTKIGVYTILRTQTLLFPSTGPNRIILVIAAATMLVGVLGAIAQYDIRRLLSFHIVSQIGYMILGIGLFTVAGIAGAVLYVINQIVVKTALFCVGGAVEHAEGTGKLKQLGGVATRNPWLAVLFALPALSLAGLPPFSGFVAKFAVLRAGLAAEQWAVVGVGLLVSLLTLFSMTKIWSYAFWGERPDPAPDIDGRTAAEPAEASPTAPGGGVAVLTAPAVTVPRVKATVGSGRVPAPMMAATGFLVAVSVAFAVFAGPLYAYSTAVANDLLDPAGYISAVLR